MGASRMDLQSCCLLLVLLFTVALAINRDKVDKTIIIIVVISKPYSFSKIPSTEWKEPASK